MGANGCSARACHGGPAPVSPNGSLDAKWENAYTIWARHDKHAEAYHALEGKLAGEMIARLRGRQPGGAWHNATDEPRCLACHVTPVLATAPRSSFHAEGVSCDACHTAPGGSTGDWYEPHKTKSPAPGMRGLGTANLRAAVCVECHVGAPAGGSIPIREVTHDMIAAGHPRLNFEYLTYLALLPRHWHERDRAPDGPAAWYAGQVATARAGQALSAGRAPASGPELADWNCFACHHDLGPAGTVGRPQHKPLQRAGQPSDPLARVASPLAANDPEAGRKLIAALRLSERYAAGELDRMTWDDAAQTYYALRAAKRPEIAPDLDRLADLLRLPRSPAVVNSPVGYDPKAVAKVLAEIAEKGAK